MLKTVLQFTLLFIVLILAQAIVFNHICLFGVAIPLVFIYLIMRLPITLNISWVLTVSFLLGLSVDIFSDTQGQNALACTILASLRMPVFHLYFSKQEDMNGNEPSCRSIGVATFSKYALSLSLIYCTLYFLIEALTFFNSTRLVLKILASSMLTFILIVAIDLLTVRSRRREKRL